MLPGEVASYATGINNHGQIVGARAGILGTPYGFGWLYTDADGLVSLNTKYGWFATPGDINDHGVILSETQVFDLTTETLTDVGLSGPSNYNSIGGVAINNAGQILGNATLRSSSLNIASVFRYTPGSGWIFISGSSRYTAGTGINNLGDLGWGELGAGIYFEGIGQHALGSLLDPATAAAGWSIAGNVIFRAEVAGDPAGPWSSDAHTAVEILHDDSERLIARDRTQVGSAEKRFIRLRIDTAP